MAPLTTSISRQQCHLALGAQLMVIPCSLLLPHSPVPFHLLSKCSHCSKSPHSQLLPTAHASLTVVTAVLSFVLSHRSIKHSLQLFLTAHVTHISLPVAAQPALLNGPPFQLSTSRFPLTARVTPLRQHRAAAAAVLPLPPPARPGTAATRAGPAACDRCRCLC